MKRRLFLKISGAAALGAFNARAMELQPRVIDSHVHFYDPARPEGVPWPPKNDPLLYRTVLPKHFHEAAAGQGITGVVVVEASDRLEDNQWLLELAAKEPLIAGVVGNLKPGRPEFAQELARFARQPLFRGLRIHSTSLEPGLARSEFVADLEQIAERDLALDLHAGWETLPAVAKLAERLPKLRVVLDHLPFDRAENEADRALNSAALRIVAEHPRVFVKASHVPRRLGDELITEVEFYRPALDQLWELFGEDRIIYGSNWPVCEKVASLAEGLRLMRAYLSGRSADAARKYFAENSEGVYRWIARLPQQGVAGNA